MWFELLKQPELSMGDVGLINLDNVPDEDDCCNKFKGEAIAWAKKWTLVEYHEFLYTLNCEEVYEAMNVYLIPESQTLEIFETQVRTNHPSKVKIANKEIKDIKNRWDKECKKDKEYSKHSESWWNYEE